MGCAWRGPANAVPELGLPTDDKPVFDALREAGATWDLAYRVAQRIRDMAAGNVIARLDAEAMATCRVVEVVMFVMAVLASGVIAIATVVFPYPRAQAFGQPAPGEASPGALPSRAEGDPAAQ